MRDISNEEREKAFMDMFAAYKKCRESNKHVDEDTFNMLWVIQKFSAVCVYIERLIDKLSALQEKEK